MSAAETLAAIRAELASAPAEERARIVATAKQIYDIVTSLGAVGVFAVALVGATIEHMIEEGQL